MKYEDYKKKIEKSRNGANSKAVLFIVSKLKGLVKRALEALFRF